MARLFEEVIGWFGVVLILLAYALVSFGVIGASDLAYQVLNFVGAACVVYISIKKKAWQPAGLNIVWAVIAIIAILRILVSLI